MNSVLGVSSSDELPNQLSGDRPLAALERGSLQQALGTYPGSTRDLSGAEPALELLDMKTDPIGALGSYLVQRQRQDLPDTAHRAPFAQPDQPVELPGGGRSRWRGGRGAALPSDARLSGVARHQGRGAGDARRLPRRLRLRTARRGRPRAALLRGSIGGGTASIARRADRPVGAHQSVPRAARVRRAGAAGAARRASLHRRPELLVVLSLGRVPHKEPRRIPVGAAVGIAGTLASGNVDWLKYGAGKVVVYPELGRDAERARPRHAGGGRRTGRRRTAH